MWIVRANRITTTFCRMLAIRMPARVVSGVIGVRCHLLGLAIRMPRTDCKDLAVTIICFFGRLRFVCPARIVRANLYTNCTYKISIFNPFLGFRLFEQCLPCNQFPESYQLLKPYSVRTQWERNVLFWFAHSTGRTSGCLFCCLFRHRPVVDRFLKRNREC